jgi:hypothetical protein
MYSSAPFSANPFSRFQSSHCEPLFRNNNEECIQSLLSLLTENVDQEQHPEIGQLPFLNPYFYNASQGIFNPYLSNASQAIFNPYRSNASQDIFHPYFSHASQGAFDLYNSTFCGSSTLSQTQKMPLQELIYDRNRDLALDRAICVLADSIRTPRRSDHLVRQLMRGSPVDKSEAVSDILADRVKDKVISKIVQVILEDKRHDRAIDSSIAMVQNGLIPQQPTLTQQINKNARQQAFDTNLFHALQRVKANDRATCFGFDQGRKTWGFPNEPFTGPSIASTGCVPNSTRDIFSSSCNAPGDLLPRKTWSNTEGDLLPRKSWCNAEGYFSGTGAQQLAMI